MTREAEAPVSVAIGEAMRSLQEARDHDMPAASVRNKLHRIWRDLNRLQNAMLYIELELETHIRVDDDAPEETKEALAKLAQTAAGEEPDA